MRRRRRSGGTWFPVFGTPMENTGEAIVDPVGQQFQFSWSGSSYSETGYIQPIIPDAPPNEDPNLGSQGLLNDIVGQEYFLKRIVGKFHAGITSVSTSSGVPTNVKLTAGFCVARADSGDSNRPAGCISPFSTDVDPVSFQNFSPNANSNIREPWIWRRTWILGNPRVASDTTWSIGAFPRHNYSGSVLDGPHIDAKTKRRVSNDDRLWFAVSCRNFPYDEINNTPLVVTCLLDIRIFAQMRKARNRGNF